PGDHPHPWASGLHPRMIPRSSTLLSLMLAAPPEVSTLSLHDALPILVGLPPALVKPVRAVAIAPDKSVVAATRGNRVHLFDAKTDRKSTRLNSSHGSISYAVFGLQKKTTITAVQVLTRPHSQQLASMP